MSKRSLAESVLSLLDIEDIEKIEVEYVNGKEVKLSFDEAQNEEEREEMLEEWLDNIKWKFVQEFEIKLYDGIKYKITYGDD
ncbi:hypothetical protein ASG89_25180 [Paenibacillus sp. Soil766]|nr:hypothetical protein ASG89_25180 [Paenibacillus sp. Soil766]